MTPIAESWITLAIQVPLVGLFIAFSLMMIDKFLKSIQQLTAAFAASVEAVTKSFVESGDKRDAAWRDFFNQQREANNMAIQNMAVRFSDEIRALGKEVSELRGLHKQ
ncbi:MAG: hypothetical protein HY864_00835 [Chloroflexi bacterium]|nr:hypothetical protein [Chloroflexota bacterium]